MYPPYRTPGYPPQGPTPYGSSFIPRQPTPLNGAGLVPTALPPNTAYIGRPLNPSIGGGLSNTGYPNTASHSYPRGKSNAAVESSVEQYMFTHFYLPIDQVQERINHLL